MKVSLTRSVFWLLVIALSASPATEDVGRADDTGTPADSGSPGSESARPLGAPAPAGDRAAVSYPAWDQSVGYHSQSAYETFQRNAAGVAVMESTVGRAVMAPFGPRVVLDGNFGQSLGVENNYYNARTFLPWHVDPGRSLFFADLGGSVTELGDFVGNFGIGHRMLFPEYSRVIGASVWGDVDDTHHQTYYRVGGSLEWLGKWLEVRSNFGFMIEDNDLLLSRGLTGEDPFFRDNRILIPFFSTSEFAYDMADVEAGGPMPGLGRYGINLYGGAYFVWHQDDEEALGYQIRAEANITDDLQAGVRVTRDDVFGLNTLVNVALTLPDGKPSRWFRPRPTEEKLGASIVRNRRMPIIVQTKDTPQTAINPRNLQPFFVIHVDPNTDGTGDGTFERPYMSLEVARRNNRAGIDIIRVLARNDDTGTNLAVNAPFGLFDNQRLLSASIEHAFTATQGTFRFPGFTGGPLPRVSNAMGGDVIMLADNNEVSGFRIDGGGTGNGIVGNLDSFNLNRNTIENTVNGIRLLNAQGTGLIESNTITGATNNGILITATTANPLDLTLASNVVRNNQGDGVSVTAMGGTVTGRILDNTVTGNGRNGILLAADGGQLDFRTLEELRVVMGNRFSGNMDNGLLVTSTNNSTVDLRLLDNGFGAAAAGLQGNGSAGFRMIADSGLSRVDVGGPAQADGNRFFGNDQVQVAFDLSGTAELELLFQNNVIGLMLDEGDVIRAGFMGNTLAANDDLSTGLVPIGFNANFFGNMFNQLFVNNNGNVTFNNPLATFTPFPIVTNGIPMIAPFFADVDTRLGNEVTYGQGMVNGRPAFGVNYLDVRHFSINGTNQGLPTNSFQLVLIDRSDVAPGDFDIEFNYDRILWEAGEASGSDPFGLGGSSARVGFTNGTTTSFELAGSGVNGAFLDSGPPATSLVQNSLNSTLLGRYRFEARGGAVSTTPTGPGVDGLQVNATDAARVRVANVDANEATGISGHGINFDIRQGAQVDDLRITDNTIRSVGRNGVQLTAADLATINLSAFVDNSLTGNGLSGAHFEAAGGGRLNVTNVAGNEFGMNNSHGLLVRSTGAGSTVAGIVGLLGQDVNVFIENQGAGVQIEALNGGTTLGPEGTGHFRVVNNVFIRNRQGGLSALADSLPVPPNNSVLNLTVGGPEEAYGNTFTGNHDFGIGIRTRTSALANFLVQNNTISGTVDNMATADPIDPIGDGIYLNRGERSLLLAHVRENTSMSSQGSGLRLVSSGDGPGNASQPMTGTPNMLTLTMNAFTQNSMHGARFETLADSITVVGSTQDSYTANSMDGISIAAMQNSGFGDPPNNTFSVFDGITATGNMDDGIDVTGTGGSRTFLRIQSSDAVGQTLIADNMSDGIEIDHTSTGNSNIVVQSDPNPAGTAFTTTIRDNGDMTTGGNGIDITSSAGNSTFTIQRTEVTGSINSAMGTDGDGIQITASGGDPTFLIGSAAVGQNLGNVLQNNSGDGLATSITGGTPTFTVVENIFGARLGELAGGNTGHGVNIAASGGTPDMTFLANQISRNNGRGVNVLVSGTVGARAADTLGATARFIFDQGNAITANGLEGIFYNADPQVAQDRTVLLDNTGFPGDDRPPSNWPGALAAAPPADYFTDFLNLDTDNNTFLRVANNTIQANGQRNIDSDGIGGVDGDGLYIRVGTNAYVAADVQNNTFGGNLNADFRTESFVSAMNAVSVDNMGAGTNDVVVLKDTAQLDLLFENNTGNQINVTNVGATHTNDALTGNVFAALFQVDSLTGTNTFNDVGGMQNIPAAFGDSGGAITPGAYHERDLDPDDPLFPASAFPQSFPNPDNSPFLIP